MTFKSVKLKFLSRAIVPLNLAEQEKKIVCTTLLKSNFFKSTVTDCESRSAVSLGNVLKEKQGLYLLVAIPAESEDGEDNEVLGASHHIPFTKDDITT